MENSVIIIPPPDSFERRLPEDTLLKLTESIKLSCCFFDKIYIDKDITNQVPDFASAFLSSDTEILRPGKHHHRTEKIGKQEMLVYPTSSESIEIVELNKEFPASDALLSQAKHAAMKFRNRDFGYSLEYEILGQLSKMTKEHYVSTFHLMATQLNAHSNTYHDSTTNTKLIEESVAKQLTKVFFPDLKDVPLRDLLKQRKTKSFEELQKFIKSVSNKADNDITKVSELILADVILELSKKLMTNSKYAVSICTGLAGYLPLISNFVNTYNIGKDTKQFIEERSHWLTFFTSILKN